MVCYCSGLILLCKAERKRRRTSRFLIAPGWEACGFRIATARGVEDMTTEGRHLPYDAEAAPVQRCLWAAVTAAQDEPSLAPWFGPTEQQAYGSMAAAAVDKVFEHLHTAHDALARVVGRQQPSPSGPDPAGGDPPESGKRLRAAILRYDTLAACAPAAYQADAARHGIRSEAALRLTEELRGASPGFRPATQGQLQEELERQAAAVEEDIRHLRALLAADRKRAVKDFWRRHAQDIAQRWKPVRGAIEPRAPTWSLVSSYQNSIFILKCLR